MRALALAAAAATLAGPAPGANRNWLGGGTTSNSWNLIFNWDSAPVSSFTDDLFIGDRGNWLTSLNNLGPLQLNTLNLSGRNWTIGQSFAPLTQEPSALLFAADGGIRASGAGLVHEVQGRIVANASDPNAIFVPRSFVTEVTAAELRLTGPVSGLGALVKTGAGTLTLSGSNTYLGGTAVRGGLVRAGSSTALGQGPLTLLGGNFDVAGQTVSVSALRFNDQTQVGITGALRATGGGKLLLAGPLVYDDTPITAQNNPLIIDADVSLGAERRLITSNSHFGTTSYDVIFRGQLEGAGGMLVDRFMTSVALARPSTLGGPVLVRDGSLHLLATDALANAASLTMDQASLLFSTTDSAGGAIATGSFNQTLRVLQGTGQVLLGAAQLTVGGFEGAAEFSGRILGTGSVLKQGIGTWTLSGANNYTGGTTVLAGAVLGTTDSLRGAFSVVGTLGLIQDGDGSFAGSVRGTGLLVKDGIGSVDARAPGTLSAFTGRIDVRGGVLKSSFDQVHRALPLTGVGALEVQVDASSRWTAPLSGDGRLIKTGTGTLQMASQTWGGSFAASAGVVEFNSVQYSGAALATDSGGSMVLRGPSTVLQAASLTNRGSLSGSGRIDAPVVSSGLVNVRAPDHLVLSHAGGMINTGTLQLQAGVLDVTGTLDNRAEGRVTGSGLLSVGILHNQGSVDVPAGARLVIAGTVTGRGGFSGPGQVELRGTLRPGDGAPARLLFAGDLVLGSSSTLQLALQGTAAGAQHDQLAVAGSALAGGTLEVSLGGGFMPRNGDTFQLLQGRWSGSFDALALPALGPGLAWDTSALLSTGVLAAVPEPPAALFFVAGGLLMWRRHRRRAHG